MKLGTTVCENGMGRGGDTMVGRGSCLRGGGGWGRVVVVVGRSEFFSRS